MTKNRKKLLKYLETLDDHSLARAVELPCDKCPAKKECDKVERGIECPEIFELWIGE